VNVEIGTETPIFLFWEYLFRKFRYFVFAVQVKMLLVLLLVTVGIATGGLASASTAHGIGRRNSSVVIHRDEAGCTTSFIADKIHYYNSASRVTQFLFYHTVYISCPLAPRMSNWFRKSSRHARTTSSVHRRLISQVVLNEDVVYSDLKSESRARDRNTSIRNTK
jgi:hypothetical protein